MLEEKACKNMKQVAIVTDIRFVWQFLQRSGLFNGPPPSDFDSARPEILQQLRSVAPAAASVQTQQTAIFRDMAVVP
jgi:hypothetical protein